MGSVTLDNNVLRARRTKSSRPEGPKAGPKGRYLEVGARRAPRLLVCCMLAVFLLQTNWSVFQIIQIIGETDWAVYSVQLTECGSFAGHMTSVVCSEKCYTSLISR